MSFFAIGFHGQFCAAFTLHKVRLHLICWQLDCKNARKVSAGFHLARQEIVYLITSCATFVVSSCCRFPCCFYPVAVFCANRRNMDLRKDTTRAAFFTKKKRMCMSFPAMIPSRSTPPKACKRKRWIPSLR